MADNFFKNRKLAKALAPMFKKLRKYVSRFSINDRSSARRKQRARS